MWKALLICALISIASAKDLGIFYGSENGQISLNFPIEHEDETTLCTFQIPEASKFKLAVHSDGISGSYENKSCSLVVENLEPKFIGKWHLRTMALTEENFEFSIVIADDIPTEIILDDLSEDYENETSTSTEYR